MIYLIESDCRSFTKIGVAKDVKSRASALQTACPLKLSVRAVCCPEAGMPDVEFEKGLHARFSHLRHRGEWFAVSASVLLDDLIYRWHPVCPTILHLCREGVVLLAKSRSARDGFLVHGDGTVWRAYTPGVEGGVSCPLADSVSEGRFPANRLVAA